ncbi:MAG: four helix bundle protein [Candidatus Liptonbacteria bacterium]|nr:four helix bundle protein [Candidatus Liptonbacteria bacterium]
MPENSEKTGKIKDYRDLLVWQKSCQLISKGLKILRAVRKDFVSEAIVRQLVRSLLSIRANIVEGWCGHRGKSFISFLEISRGSAGETEDWFFALCSEGYISEDTYIDISKNCRELMAMLTGLIRALRT